MRPLAQDPAAPAALRDKALNLREAVNSTRARMHAQREKLERLRMDIAELRKLAEKPLPSVLAAPLMQEAVPVSASETTSFKTGAHHNSWKPVPYVAIFFLAAGMQIHASRTAAVLVAPAVAAVQPVAAPVVDEDDGADEALLLAHDWRLPGDERPLSERLGADTNPPGTEPEWTAERTGERTYRVSYRASGSDVDYDFDVDLTARRVDPTPETAELISPRLISRS